MPTTISGSTGVPASAIQNINVTALPYLVSQICHFASPAAPAGFRKCNGDAVSRTTYAALYAAIGTTYGVGDGNTTFNLPDVRGYHLRSLDDGRGVDTGRVAGSIQSDQMLAHAHALNDPGHAHGVYDPTHAHSVYDPGHQHGLNSIPSNTNNFGAQGFFDRSAGGSPTGLATDVGGTNLGIYGAGTGIGIYGAGTGQTIANSAGGSEIRVKNMAFLACIFTGV